MLHWKTVMFGDTGVLKCRSPIKNISCQNIVIYNEMKDTFVFKTSISDYSIDLEFTWDLYLTFSEHI